MRAAIVIPPVLDFYFTPQRASFLGVRTIAAVLGRNHVDYRIINSIRKNGRPAELPEELSYLLPYLGNEFFFKGYRRFGISNENVIREIKEYNPDRILVSCFAFCYALEAIGIINDIKRQLPGIPVIAGGAGVTVYPEYFSAHSDADYICAGEADETIVRILDNPGQGIKSSIDKYHPESFIPVLAQTGESKDVRYFSTMITRGCPMQCAFCSVNMLFPAYRRSSIDDIKSMFSPIQNSGKKIHINFEDDNVLYDFEYFIEILDILRIFTNGNFSFSLENGSEFRSLDESKIKLLKRYNIKQLNLSLVTINQDILNDNNRRYSADQFADIAAICGRLKIPVIAYCIAGLPGESCESINETIEFMSALPVLIGISPFYPIPGIKGYEDRSVFNEISPRLCAGMSFYPWNECGTGELMEIFMKARRISLDKFNSDLNH